MTASQVIEIKGSGYSTTQVDCKVRSNPYNLYPQELIQVVSSFFMKIIHSRFFYVMDFVYI